MSRRAAVHLCCWRLEFFDLLSLRALEVWGMETFRSGAVRMCSLVLEYLTWGQKVTPTIPSPVWKLFFFLPKILKWDSCIEHHWGTPDCLAGEMCCILNCCINSVGFLRADNLCPLCAMVTTRIKRSAWYGSFVIIHLGKPLPAVPASHEWQIDTQLL